MQHALSQSYELLLLRHCCIAQAFPLPFLLDFCAPAICPSPSAYVLGLRQHYLRQQQQQQGETGLFGLLPPDLSSLVFEGRRSTRWMMSSICSSRKGLRLLLGLLPLLNDASTSTLLQALLSCGELIGHMCAQADAVLAAAATTAATAATTATAATGGGRGGLSSSLFEEMMRSTGTGTAAISSVKPGTLLYSLFHPPEGKETASLCAFFLLGAVRVFRAAGPSKGAVLLAFLEFMCWGMKDIRARDIVQHAVRLLLLLLLFLLLLFLLFLLLFLLLPLVSFLFYSPLTLILGAACVVLLLLLFVSVLLLQSGSCLFALLTLHLPQADGAANPCQMYVPYET